MEKELKFRDCGDCNECCKWLIVDDVLGHNIKPGKPCFYLCEEKNCTVHEQRPEVCRNYQCAWSQGILPEWMKPNKSNALVNVEKWGGNSNAEVRGFRNTINFGGSSGSSTQNWTGEQTNDLTLLIKGYQQAGGSSSDITPNAWITNNFRTLNMTDMWPENPDGPYGDLNSDWNITAKVGIFYNAARHDGVGTSNDDLDGSAGGAAGFKYFHSNALVS